MVTFLFERLKNSTSFGMKANLLELRLKEKTSGSIEFVLDVGRSAGPAVVILENGVD
jgi:hypothetical protein